MLYFQQPYAYVILIYQLHMPSYFLETFTECFFLGTEYTDFTEKNKENPRFPCIPCLKKYQASFGIPSLSF